MCWASCQALYTMTLFNSHNNLMSEALLFPFADKKIKFQTLDNMLKVKP